MGRLDLQAQSTEENHYAEMKKIREAYCEAEEYADNSGPAVNIIVSRCLDAISIPSRPPIIADSRLIRN
jgi:hypothetical protein